LVPCTTDNGFWIHDFGVPNLVAARWHAPGAETATLEVEKLNEGLRVILPKIELWGIVELEFGR